MCFISLKESESNYSVLRTLLVAVRGRPCCQQIGAEGVTNISALKSLLSVQKIPYDFGFYKMDFDVDHPTIALSSRGSVVPMDAVVPVVASGETCTVSDAATLSRLRVYVEATRRLQLSLDEFSSSFAEEDFVKARQDGHALTVRCLGRMVGSLF